MQHRYRNARRRLYIGGRRIRKVGGVRHLDDGVLHTGVTVVARNEPYARDRAHHSEVDANPRLVLRLGVEARSVVAVGRVGKPVSRTAVERGRGHERAEHRVRRGEVQIGAHRPLSVGIDAAHPECRRTRPVDGQIDDLPARPACARDVPQLGEFVFARVFLLLLMTCFPHDTLSLC